LTPNLTEACMLADIPYPDLSLSDVSEAEKTANGIINKLSSIYPHASIALTGVVCKDKMITLCKERKSDTHLIETELHPTSFPGTGDLFASLLLSEILHEKSFLSATEKASELTTYAVKLSQNTDEDVRNGILLEKFLYETDF